MLRLTGEMKTRYAHTQQTNAWMYLLILGILSITLFVLFFIILPAVGQFWGFLIAGVFVNSMIYVYTSRFYKLLAVEELNDTSIRIYFPLIKVANPICLSHRSLERGVTVKYENIISYKVYHLKEPGSLYFTGAFPGGCCSDPVPVYISINERKCGGCSRKWKTGHKMIEFKLKNAITFGDCVWCNDCQYACCKGRCREDPCVRHSKKLRIGIADADACDALVELLLVRGVKREGGLAMQDGVELAVASQVSDHEENRLQDDRAQDQMQDAVDGRSDNEIDDRAVEVQVRSSSGDDNINNIVR